MESQLAQLARLRERAARTVELSLFWLQRGQVLGGDLFPGFERRCALLIDAALGDLPEETLLGALDSKVERLWSEWISLRGVESKAKAQGEGSLAARWLMSLPGYDPSREQSEQTQEQHGYIQMNVGRIINAGWIFSGVYGQESEMARQACELMIKQETTAIDEDWLGRAHIESLVARLEASVAAHREKEDLIKATAGAAGDSSALRM